MANLMMIIGLVGMVLGVLSPIYRVLNNKSRRSKTQAMVVIASFFIFILGVIIGLL
ncbi:hypothetical protein [Alkaliphilus peptidifermentans]|uniref:Uncharacterized protein n=1 Tax=Alkaliphilus peptidifermentans DSM 18978 TaxID=1120976 RepID=A0A1G5L8H7_9FIRM|nr:hypothetical protein [Alkaliphilus peptidifermentans]SCZ09162.1 hypothetical protein SAMN03080606_04177 [Alkaliphilus peptidifermentans DSM 18978]